MSVGSPWSSLIVRVLDRVCVSPTVSGSGNKYVYKSHCTCMRPICVQVSLYVYQAQCGPVPVYVYQAQCGLIPVYMHQAQCGPVPVYVY